MQERYIPDFEFEEEPALPRTFILSNEAFRHIPSILYDLVQTEPEENLQYTWSAHGPFIFTCHPLFPTEIFCNRLLERKALFEEINTRELNLP